MPASAFLWAIVCWWRGSHSWGEWEALPYEHLRDVKRCRCGVERERRRGLI
jgi:hypothetical protein